MYIYADKLGFITESFTGFTQDLANAGGFQRVFETHDSRSFIIIRNSKEDYLNHNCIEVEIIEETKSKLLGGTKTIYKPKITHEHIEDKFFVDDNSFLVHVDKKSVARFLSYIDNKLEFTNNISKAIKVNFIDKAIYLDEVPITCPVVTCPVVSDPIIITPYREETTVGVKFKDATTTKYYIDNEIYKVKHVFGNRYEIELFYNPDSEYKASFHDKVTDKWMVEYYSKTYNPDNYQISHYYEYGKKIVTSWKKFNSPGNYTTLKSNLDENYGYNLHRYNEYLNEIYAKLPDLLDPTMKTKKIEYYRGCLYLTNHYLIQREDESSFEFSETTSNPIDRIIEYINTNMRGVSWYEIPLGNQTNIFKLLIKGNTCSVEAREYFIKLCEDPLFLNHVKKNASKFITLITQNIGSNTESKAKMIDLVLNIKELCLNDKSGSSGMINQILSRTEKNRKIEGDEIQEIARKIVEHEDFMFCPDPLLFQQLINIGAVRL